jgi:hypothetical protein
MAFDDPLVFPGEPGKSHLHVFFGNTGTNAYSTAATIAGSGNSTCRGGIANRSAYWVPATIDTRTGTPVKPAQAGMYYKNGYNGIRADEIRPFPKGLRMIAGDATNSSTKGPWRFVCVYPGGDNKEHREIPDCPVGSQLFQMVFFPQCWDGRNLDSPDHKSHMSYPVNRHCPESHPVPIPEITFNIQYDVREPASRASGGWPRTCTRATSRWPLDARRLVRRLGAVGQGGVGEGCNQAARDCHSHLLGDGGRSTTLLGDGRPARARRRAAGTGRRSLRSAISAVMPSWPATKAANARGRPAKSHTTAAHAATSATGTTSRSDDTTADSHACTPCTNAADVAIDAAATAATTADHASAGSGATPLAATASSHA